MPRMPRTGCIKSSKCLDWLESDQGEKFRGSAAHRESPDGTDEMTIGFSDTQSRRLRELGVNRHLRRRQFDDAATRDRSFQAMETQRVESERRRLMELREGPRRPRLCRLEQRLAEMLATEGFVQVSTPIIMSKSSLTKMGIGDDHPLIAQVFWLDTKKCLRPMLAPHLYAVVRDLLRIWQEPVRIFEIGPCFRKESQGAQHANEFTMLNLAEFGVPPDQRKQRIQDLAARVLDCADVTDVAYKIETSEVYGDTIDIVGRHGELELASSAMGPHPLDRQWRITASWVGIGFGLERLLMAGEEDANMGRMCRSLSYLDGIRLNI